MPILAALLAIACCSQAAQRLDLDLSSPEWETSTKGAFGARLDRRGVLTMSHTDTPARNGDHATVARTVDLPDDLKGPLVLRFYLTDDYCGDKEQAVYQGDAVKERVSDWREEVRVCEVLLGDVVVWSKDVIGGNGTTAGERFYDLEIGDLVKKQASVELAFRVRDIAGTEGETFATDVFWARPELLWSYGKTPPAVEFPPRLAFRRERFAPAASPAPLAGSTTLTVRNPTDVWLVARPIRWGLPLPQGAVSDGLHVALQDAAEQPVPLETQVLARWPDGSVKWLLLDFVAPLPPGDTRYSLSYGTGVGGATERTATYSEQPRTSEADGNLSALMGAYGATGDEAMLRAATKSVEEVLAYLDPVRGVSSAPIYEQTAYEGGTPSGAAILMRGLGAYYEVTKDERVGWAVCGLCDWLECEMMPSPGRFYDGQAPQLRTARPQLVALDGAAFAWNFTGDPVYRQLALDVYREGVADARPADMRDMANALVLLATALPPDVEIVPDADGGVDEVVDDDAPEDAANEDVRER